MIPILRLDNPEDRETVESLLARLRLAPADVALGHGKEVIAVNEILADVAKRGDDAVVDSSRKFDDPAFTASQIRVTTQEMSEAAMRVPPQQMAAIRHAIAQVRDYQQ